MDPHAGGRKKAGAQRALLLPGTAMFTATSQMPAAKMEKTQSPAAQNCSAGGKRSSTIVQHKYHDRKV